MHVRTLTKVHPAQANTTAELQFFNLILGTIGGVLAFVGNIKGLVSGS